MQLSEKCYKEGTLAQIKDTCIIWNILSELQKAIVFRLSPNKYE